MRGGASPRALSAEQVITLKALLDAICAPPGVEIPPTSAEGQAEVGEGSAAEVGGDMARSEGEEGESEDGDISDEY